LKLKEEKIMSKKKRKKRQKKKKIESNNIEPKSNDKKSDSESKVKSIDTYNLQGFERYMFGGLFIGAIIFLLVYLFGLIYFLIT
jgi:VIT1/CCC1 family predicted Fe2+/Mn2+ transporter